MAIDSTAHGSPMASVAVRPPYRWSLVLGMAGTQTSARSEWPQSYLTTCDKALLVDIEHWLSQIFGDGSKPWYLVNPKIAGKWMFIPLKIVLIGIDPYPFLCKLLYFLPRLPRVWSSLRAWNISPFWMVKSTVNIICSGFNHPKWGY